MKNNGFASKMMNSKAGKAAQTAALAFGLSSAATGCTIEVGEPHAHVDVIIPACGVELVEDYYPVAHTYEVGRFAGVDAYGVDLYQYSCVAADTWLYDSCTGEDILQRDGYDVSITSEKNAFVNHYTDALGRDICKPGLDY